MKLYKIYKTNEDHDLFLYALTNEKNKFKEFKEMRNHDLFIFTDPVEVTRQEYADFANANRDNVLDYFKIATKGVDDGVICIKYVEILATQEEFLTLKDIDTGSEIGYLFETADTNISYICFNKKIRKALKLLQFDSFYKLFSRVPVIDEREDDYEAPNFETDEFSVFATNYRTYFK